MKWYNDPHFWRGGAKGAAIAYAMGVPAALVFWAITGRRSFLGMALICVAAVGLLAWMYRRWPGVARNGP